MKLLFLNPNSTEAMTDSVVATAQAMLPEAEILGWTNHDGPPAIQGPEDGAAALAGQLALLPQAQAEAVDVIIIACFDDTGLEEMREVAHCPVIGIGQAAYHMALLSGDRFGVVTTLDVSVPVIETNIRQQGFTARSLGVRASGIPVLDVEEGRSETLEHLASEIQIMSRDGAKTVILGCAGMSGHYGTLSHQTGVKLIDGVRAATVLAQAIARMSADAA